MIRSDAEKILKGLTVTDKELGHLVGEVILEFQDDNFEHEDDIKIRSSAFGLRPAKHGEKGTKGFPIDIGGETFKEIIELLEFDGTRFDGDKVRMHIKQ
ncbi:MAG: hypothetical protein LBU65_13000 [Planctomycetaceae bacterium]|nr:hypothetical protein [Planctomycetaceae bacterium]